MFFYKIEAKITDPSLIVIEGNEDYGFSKKINVIPQSLHNQRDKNGTLFVSSLVGDDKVLMGAIARNSDWLDKNFKGFLIASEFDCSDFTTDEITFSDFISLLKHSEKEGYSRFNTDETILNHFDIYDLYGRLSITFKEIILQKPLLRAKLFKLAGNQLCVDSLIPELERIYQPPNEVVTGHPVHYFIQCDNDYLCDNIYELLISALHANNRLKSKKYAVLSISEKNFSRCECEALYEACTGGALVIKCGEKIEGELSPEDRLLRAIFGEKYNGNDNDNYDNSDMFWLSTICKTALKYRNDTLTFFCLPRTSERVKVKMREALDIMTLVDITETFASKDSAKKFLKQTAHRRNVKVSKSLYDVTENEQTAFSSTELLRAFDVWYSKHLKSHSYPQYASFTSSGQISAKETHKGDAFSELEQLIGLKEAKTVIKQAVDYFRAQRLLCDRGLSAHRPSMHMIFSGAPGTAKTTVARLFARILRENELLSIGKLYEVGRADLVGRFVGWTAQKVEKKFSEAMGSVLFIDEAYSLVDDRDGSYGDEAISTIVSEMENRRDDIVVIFAGYTEKMEGFLYKNPGLRSRISFHVPFADYDTEELYQILEHIAVKQSLILDYSVEEKLMPLLSKARCEPDFGNGRYVRNLIERARMNQAGRLLEMDIDKVTSDQATRLLANDFEELTPARPSVQQIGFATAG